MQKMVHVCSSGVEMSFFLRLELIWDKLKKMTEKDSQLRKEN